MLVILTPRLRRVARVTALTITLLVGVLLALGSAVASAQRVPTRPAATAATPAPQPAAAPITYVYVRGTNDTIGLEVIRHTATAVSGVLTMKGQPRVEWSHAVRSGVPGVLTMRMFAPNAAADATPLQTGTVDVRGDSAFVDFSGGGQTIKRGIATTTGAMPLVNASVLHATLLAAHARLTNSGTLSVFLTSGAQTMQATVSQSADTTVMKLATSDMRIVAGRDGMPVTILLPGQNARVVRANSAVSESAARINYDAPADAPYVAQHVRIPSGRGYDLAATLTVPKGVAKAPVVITISGSGPQDRDGRIAIVPGYQPFRQIADTLGRRGVAVLRFDDRGVGESGGLATATKATSADFADDVRSLITWLRARPDIDGARIMLVGHSEGGIIAPMVAATDPALRAIALLAGTAYPGKRILMYQNQQGVNALTALSQKQRDSVMATVPAQLDSAGKATPWLGFFMAHDPLVTARRVKQPVLVLQGLTDQQVTPEQADTLSAVLRASGNRDVVLAKVPATNHLLLSDSSGAPQGYATLKDVRLGRAVLGPLVDWVVRVAK